MSDMKTAISADVKWRLLGHAEEMKAIEPMLSDSQAASKIASYILERDQRKKKEFAKIGPCGKHPLVCYVGGIGFDGAESYKAYHGYGFPMENYELTDAGLVRVCEMCQQEYEAAKATKQ